MTAIIEKNCIFIYYYLFVYLFLVDVAGYISEHLSVPTDMYTEGTVFMKPAVYVQNIDIRHICI